MDTFGTGGGGAPLRDQHGEMITIRKPNMTNTFERTLPKGILKK